MSEPSLSTHGKPSGSDCSVNNWQALRSTIAVLWKLSRKSVRGERCSDSRPTSELLMPRSEVTLRLTRSGAGETAPNKTSSTLNTEKKNPRQKQSRYVNSWALWIGTFRGIKENSSEAFLTFASWHDIIKLTKKKNRFQRDPSHTIMKKK